jgi:hypothetical protein
MGVIFIIENIQIIESHPQEKHESVTKEESEEVHK